MTLRFDRALTFPSSSIDVSYEDSTTHHRTTVTLTTTRTTDGDMLAEWAPPVRARMVGKFQRVRDRGPPERLERLVPDLVPHAREEHR